MSGLYWTLSGPSLFKRNLYSYYTLKHSDSNQKSTRSSSISKVSVTSVCDRRLGVLLKRAHVSRDWTHTYVSRGWSIHFSNVRGHEALRVDGLDSGKRAVSGDGHPDRGIGLTQTRQGRSAGGGGGGGAVCTFEVEEVSGQIEVEGSNNTGYENEREEMREVHVGKNVQGNENLWRCCEGIPCLGHVRQKWWLERVRSSWSKWIEYWYGI